MRSKILIVPVLILMLGAAEAIRGPEYMPLAQAQIAEGNTAPALGGGFYVDIMNATSDLMPKIAPGAYDSNSYVIPVGPYEVSFQMRTPLKAFGVGYYAWNQTAGSGKAYRKNEYEKYELGTRPEEGYFDISITHYIGPAEYPPENPDPYGYNEVPGYGLTRSWGWENTNPAAIAIDGRTGFVVLAYYTKNKSFKDVYVYSYEMNSNTFITIKSNMDLNKDISLAIDTMHITMASH